MTTTTLLNAAIDRGTLLALVDASRVINGDLGLPAMFDRIAEQAAAVLRAEGASVLLLNEGGRELTFVTATGPVGRQLVGQRMSAESGIAGQTLRTQRAVCVNEVARNRHFFDGIDAKTHLRTRCLMAAPLIHRETALGVVEVINPLGRSSFDDRDLELLKVFANLAASATRNAQQIDRISRDNQGLRSAMPTAAIVGRSPALERVTALCKKVAAATTTALITGETGSGKEMAARMIHQHSPRADRPFVAVNCAALPENLMESELFGHERGAFTGADQRKLGRFELANHGTLFLDEVGELSAAAQTKLLRVLQEKELTRVGGTQAISCDARIIAATNRNFEDEVRIGRFREDLFYRLNIFPIRMPPLRDRREDIPLLAAHFIGQIAPELGVAPPIVEESVIAALTKHDWPGNVRELRNVMERCALLAEGEITLAHLPAEIAEAHTDRTETIKASSSVGEVEYASALTIQSKLAAQERAMVLEALVACGWNQSAAARRLGVSRDHLRYRIKKYKLKCDGELQ